MGRLYRLNGIDWRVVADSRLEKDNYICQECGDKIKTLIVHHVIPLCYGGTNKLKNLITLCESCHAYAHKKLIENGKDPQ